MINTKNCVACDKTYNLTKHHVIMAPLKKIMSITMSKEVIAEKQKIFILCKPHHRLIHKYLTYLEVSKLNTEQKVKDFVDYKQKQLGQENFVKLFCSSKADYGMFNIVKT